MMRANETTAICLSVRARLDCSCYIAVINVGLPGQLRNLVVVSMQYRLHKLPQKSRLLNQVSVARASWAELTGTI